MARALTLIAASIGLTDAPTLSLDLEAIARAYPVEQALAEVTECR